MIQGNKYRKLATKKEIYSFTSNGKDIYIKYLGKINRGVMKRPWGSDSHPSWGVWQAPDGVWMWKDQARDEAGNPIQFVERLFGLSYEDAVKKISNDFGIEDYSDLANITPVHASNTASAQEDNYVVPITAKIRKFGPRHHAFWNAVGVTEDWCKKFDCYAVKELAINRKKVRIGENEIVFVYLAGDINKVKVYFPDREGGARFRTNVPFHYLWNCNKITNPCDKLVIHKSMKDLITFAQLYPYNIATQNESLSVFDEATVSVIKEKCEHPWLFYGSDADGMTKTKAIQEKFGWDAISTPLAMLPDINDVYSFVKEHGINKLEQYCKSKNLL